MLSLQRRQWIKKGMKNKSKKKKKQQEAATK
jgi:hypothetical protein